LVFFGRKAGASWLHAVQQNPNRSWSYATSGSRPPRPNGSRRPSPPSPARPRTPTPA